MGNPEIALQKRLLLADFFSNRRFRDEYAEKVAHRGATIEQIETSLKIAVVSILEGETFFWSAEILPLIFTAATSLPKSWQLTAPGLMALWGFAWLETPLSLKSSSFWWHAISWCVVHHSEDAPPIAILPPYNGPPFCSEDDDHLVVSYWGGGESPTGLVAPLSQIDIPFDKPCLALEGLDILGEPTLNPVATMEKTRVFATMLAFLQQRILVPESVSLTRSFRRRLQRTRPDIEEPTVKVIKLRTIVHSDRQVGAREVEWHCRWLVRGHWRNQFYPLSKTHRPKWVTPYLKGPEDQPIKTSGAAKIFAVVR